MNFHDYILFDIIVSSKYVSYKRLIISWRTRSTMRMKMMEMKKKMMMMMMMMMMR